MNKILLLVGIFLFFNNCSLYKSNTILEKKKTNVQKIENTRTVLTEQKIGEQEFNQELNIEVSHFKYSATLTIIKITLVN